MGRDLRLQVWRGDSTHGAFVEFTVAVEEGEVVLDAILRLQAEQVPDLAVRWNCKAGKCGSCSAEVNGCPQLMCMTRLSSFDPAQLIVVSPMRTFPVIRDLVTDVTYNYEKAREVPAFAPAHDNAGGTFRMQQTDVERSQEFRKCIECFLCQDVCHVIRDHEDKKVVYAGPRFFIRYAELDMHPLDILDRRRMLQDSQGLGYCNVTKCCTEVCAAGIHITDNAIIAMKERVVDLKYDPVFLGLHIGRRKDREPVDAVDRPEPSPIRRPEPVSVTPKVAVATGHPVTSRAPAQPDSGRTRHAPSPSRRARTAVAAAVAATGIGLLLWALNRSVKRHHGQRRLPVDSLV